MIQSGAVSTHAGADGCLGVCDHHRWDTAEFELKGLYRPSSIGTELDPPIVRCENVEEYGVVNVAAACVGNNNRVHHYSPTEVPAAEGYVQETDRFFGGEDDQFRDSTTPRPGYVVSALWVADNAQKQRQYALHEYPEESYCALAYCPARLYVTLRWNYASRFPGYPMEWHPVAAWRRGAAVPSSVAADVSA